MGWSTSAEEGGLVGVAIAAERRLDGEPKPLLPAPLTPCRCRRRRK